MYPIVSSSKIKIANNFNEHKLPQFVEYCILIDIDNHAIDNHQVN